MGTAHNFAEGDWSENHAVELANGTLGFDRTWELDSVSQDAENVASTCQVADADVAALDLFQSVIADDSRADLQDQCAESWEFEPPGVKVEPNDTASDLEPPLLAIGFDNDPMDTSGRTPSLATDCNHQDDID